MLYVYDNHSRIQPIDAYERARGFAEDGGRSDGVGNVSDRPYMTTRGVAVATVVMRGRDA